MSLTVTQNFYYFFIQVKSVRVNTEMFQVHHLKTHMKTNHFEEPGEGEEEAQGSSEAKGKMHSHRSPRLSVRRTTKSHLASHPNAGGGGGGSEVTIQGGQAISTPMAHSSTSSTSSVAAQTQIQAASGVNHSGLIHSYNTHIYNHGVMTHYPASALYDVCQQQNTVTHIQMH